MTAFAVSLLRVGGVALLASAAGWLIAAAFLPTAPRFHLERLGWSYGVGCGLLAAFVPLSLAVGARPGWVGFLILAAACAAAGYGLRAPRSESSEAPAQLETGDARLGTRIATAALRLLIGIGILLYALQALTEPMWSNDFLAIWGLKGKTIFASASVPSRLLEPGALGFSHPEYPLGLPFLYAGVSFLTRRWDDHAMALLFPLFQLAALSVASGWLRRRGVPPTARLAAVALLANFEPLYSGFLTGLAEVPLSLGLLLFGTALADALEPAESRAVARLALAAGILAATKNEGLFFAVAGGALALASGGRRRWRIALAAVSPALAVHALHVLWRGRLPLRDFDFSLASAARIGEALRAAAGLASPATWAGVALAVLLVALGGRNAAGNRLLALCAAGLAVYVLLPAFAVRGPVWLVQTTLLRTTSALVPLACAAIAVRFSRDAASEPAPRPRASAARPETDAPWTRAS